MTAIDTMARTVYGEARGEGAAGMTAVAWVIKNRAAKPGWWGHDIESVCRARMQFDCWNANDPNSAKCAAVTLADPYFAEATNICSAVISGATPDPTDGATYYYAKSMPHPPEWAVGKTPTATIGSQIFFRF